jgi:hypothetical protein
MNDPRDDDLIRRNRLLIEAARKARTAIKETALQCARARVQARVARSALPETGKAMPERSLAIFSMAEPLE